MPTKQNNPLPIGSLFTERDHNYIRSGYGMRPRTSLEEASEIEHRRAPLKQASNTKGQQHW